jgi:hypothetical protein
LAANVLGKTESYHGNLLFIKGGYGIPATTERRIPNPNGDYLVVYLDGEKLHPRGRA